MPEIVYHYRLHDSSITHTQASNQRVFFEETARLLLQQRIKTGVDDLERGKPPIVPLMEKQKNNAKYHVANLLLGEAWRLHQKGEKLKAIKKGVSACITVPFNCNNWRNMLFLIIKN